VPSESNPAEAYLVLLNGEHSVCSCPDHGNGNRCKHIWAAEVVAGRIGPVDVPEQVKPKAPSKKGPKPPSLIELAQQYDTKEKCLELLESLRWPNGPVCPRCECAKAYRLADRHVFQCAGCEYQYSVIVGTVMQDTRLCLTKWILAVALLCNARKGVSACQVSRDLHVTYKTAWYLCHRIRRAMRETTWLKKFTGIVEVDETYLGGKARGLAARGRSGVNKTVVFGAKERGGKVRIQAIPNVTGKTLGKVVHEYIDTDAEMVIADQLNSYNQLAAEFTMERINHTREYVRGNIHTNGIESAWAILKRQFYGTHHRMSRQYLPLYLGEISYRFNHRTEHDLFLSVLRNGLLTDKQVQANAAQEGTEDGAAEGQAG
jgi:transposase-like protein